MGTRNRAVSIAASTLVAIGVVACGSAPQPAVTVTVTPTSGAPDSTSAPTVSVTAAASTAPFVWVFGDQWLSDESVARGSGCTPGAGPLPDGVWFGFIEKWSTTEISFDLACWWSGDAAAEAAGWGPDDAFDFYISNDNTTVRKQPVAPGAMALKAGEEDGVFPLAEVIADPAGSLPTQAPYPAWLFINDGVVTGVAVQYLP